MYLLFTTVFRSNNTFTQTLKFSEFRPKNQTWNEKRSIRVARSITGEGVQDATAVRLIPWTFFPNRTRANHKKTPVQMHFQMQLRLRACSEKMEHIQRAIWVFRVELNLTCLLGDLWLALLRDAAAANVTSASAVANELWLMTDRRSQQQHTYLAQVIYTMNGEILILDLLDLIRNKLQRLYWISDNYLEVFCISVFGWVE